MNLETSEKVSQGSSKDNIIHKLAHIYYNFINILYRLSLMPAPARQSPSLVQELTMGPQTEMIRFLHEDQQSSQDDMNRLLDTIQEMVIVVARLEKRPVETETLTEAFEPDVYCHYQLFQHSFYMSL